MRIAEVEQEYRRQLTRASAFLAARTVGVMAACHGDEALAANLDDSSHRALLLGVHTKQLAERVKELRSRDVAVMSSDGYGTGDGIG